MKHCAVTFFVVLAGCYGHEDPAARIAPAQAAPTTADPIVKGIPHGGQITQVAVTEEADAALTSDNLGGVRLWPALDASRTPVPVSIVAPKQLALTHVGRDLLAAALDQAGSIDLVRLGRDGSVRGRVQLPARVAHEQVVALGEGVLVRSEDHAIEWFTADGESRGKLVADPSRRIHAIAVRNDRAVAVVGEGAKHELRWLHTFGGTLTWGPAVALPAAIKDDLIALSPSHRRLAMVDAGSTVSVYELGVAPVRIGTTVLAPDALDLGFIDEDRVAIMGNTLQWLTMPQKPATSDPWAVASPSMPLLSTLQFGEGGAVANGVAVTGFGAALALTDKDRARYLGYKDHGVGNLGAGPSSLWTTMSGSHVLWLDDRLAIKRAIELRENPNGPWLHATPIGEHHVVTQSPVDGKYVVKLVDVDRPAQAVTIGTYATVERVEYAPDARLLAVSLYGSVRRFALDLAANTVRELAPLERTGSITTLRLLDPARAGGMTAVTLGWDGEYDDYMTLTLYRDKGKKQKIKPFKGTLIDVDASGTIYSYTSEVIEVRRGTKRIATIAAKGIDSPVAMSSDGSRFAIRNANDIVVLDAQGTEQWRKPLWGAAQLVFTKDGKHLAVRAIGGLVLLAAATGERVAIECGWSFELMTTPPTSSTLAVAPVCEDPLLQ